MPFTVGQSGVANYANTSSGKVTRVVADGGVGGSGEVVNVVDRVTINIAINLNTPDYELNLPNLARYVAGKTDITVTIGASAYIYGTSNTGTPQAAISVYNGSSTDTVKIINNGYKFNF
jgi:hypothetical protein